MTSCRRPSPLWSRLFAPVCWAILGFAFLWNRPESPRLRALRRYVTKPHDPSISADSPMSSDLGVLAPAAERSATSGINGKGPAEAGTSKLKISWLTVSSILGLLMLALVPRLLLSTGGTFGPDRDWFFNWSAAATSGSLRTFYARTSSDYLPGYIYVLWLLGHSYEPAQHLAHALGGGQFDKAAFFKLPAIIADAVTVVTLYLAGRRWSFPLQGTLAAIFYAVNPAVILTSARWGQVDSVAALFMVLAVLSLAEDRAVWCGVCLALSVLTKPTAIILIPLIALVYVRRAKPMALATLAGTFLFVSLAIIWPFKPDQLSLLEFLRERFGETTSMWPYATINGFNFWALFQHDLYQHDMILHSDALNWCGISLHTWGLLLVAGLAATVSLLAAAVVPRACYALYAECGRLGL
jgi:dolichyl-phosphate-mannose-protein mannosyltransferase